MPLAFHKNKSDLKNLAYFFKYIDSAPGEGCNFLLDSNMKGDSYDTNKNRLPANRS